ncbi:MAG: four helix bundle protein [Candidatus Cloacimonetes bacterium]|nr:four helix bundle protein [Candidatus Cloacimonadota bacterium]
MKKNIILEKSFDFALMVIDIYKYLTVEKHEYIMSKQLLRSGTSIGANCNEAIAAVTTKDFCNKMAIASKETYETLYWLKLLDKSDYYHSDEAIENCEEIIRIITSIVKTTKEKLHS